MFTLKKKAGVLENYFVLYYISIYFIVLQLTFYSAFLLYKTCYLYLLFTIWCVLWRYNHASSNSYPINCSTTHKTTVIPSLFTLRDVFLAHQIERDERRCQNHMKSLCDVADGCETHKNIRVPTGTAVLHQIQPKSV